MSKNFIVFGLMVWNSTFATWRIDSFTCEILFLRNVKMVPVMYEIFFCLTPFSRTYFNELFFFRCIPRRFVRGDLIARCSFEGDSCNSDSIVGSLFDSIVGSLFQGSHQEEIPQSDSRNIDSKKLTTKIPIKDGLIQKKFISISKKIDLQGCSLVHLQDISAPSDLLPWFSQFHF